jgi:hypothetical protein
MPCFQIKEADGITFLKLIGMCVFLVGNRWLLLARQHYAGKARKATSRRNAAQRAVAVCRHNTASRLQTLWLVGHTTLCAVTLTLSPCDWLPVSHWLLLLQGDGLG